MAIGSRRQPLKRTGFKNRGKGLKRTDGFKAPRKALKPGRKKSSTRDPEEIRVFHDEAAAQRVCAKCGKNGPYDPHHVVEKAWLKARGLPQDDPRNCLRLCVNCHANHTGAHDRVPMVKLRIENLVYAFDVMGLAAFDYLQARYPGPDPRLDRVMKETHERVV